MSVKATTLVMAVSLVFSAHALAQSAADPNSSAGMSPSDIISSGAFQNDPSAPVPDVDSTIATPQLDNAPVTPQSNAQWQAYDQPLRRCLEGNTIIPSNGNDLLGFLFNSNATANVNMAITGWKGDKCAINFTEGTTVMYCRFSKATLEKLLQSLLYDDQFDRTSTFAQTLTEECQATDPDQEAQIVADQTPQAPQ